jgi:16S rRNA (adenine1518-N6/adenine1519-N6)-dimethyltransferase
VSKSHKARKRFGQHFLRSSDVIHNIVGAVRARSDDTLVEIGPGQGAITLPLAESGAKLHAVEFDRDLIGPLRNRFADFDNVTIHEADALEFDFSTLGDDLRIVGNLPYNISTPLIFHLIEFKPNIRDLFLMLQKEVVDRMCAEPGSKAYGRLTIMLGCHMEVMPLFDVPPDAFSPPPKVQSSVAALRPLRDERISFDASKRMSTLVAQAFSKRRKTVRNALKGIATEEQLDTVGIDAGSRPEQIDIDHWIALVHLLNENHPG